MNTYSSAKSMMRAFRVPAWTSILLAIFASLPLKAADFQNRSAVPAPTGYYKIVQSSDPIFPQAANQEWFLDFGQAIERGKTHGTVAVSLRENPRVQVKLLVWQLYPETGTLVIGSNEENSRRAVAIGSWRVESGNSGIVLHRDQYHVSLSRAQATD
ncbi:MAG: hypothetical protein QM680_10990 [Luteolibacter sp.]